MVAAPSPELKPDDTAKRRIAAARRIVGGAAMQTVVASGNSIGSHSLLGARPGARLAASAREGDSGTKQRERGMHRHHDMGGVPAGPVVPAEHEYAAWEKRVDAILRLLVARGVINVDELRRGIEELGPGAYDELTYYQRWIASIGNNLLEKGVISVDELGSRLAAVEARWRGAGRTAGAP
jgi:hypothetical protein